MLLTCLRCRQTRLAKTSIPPNLQYGEMEIWSRVMALRKGNETMIETHTYSQHDFSTNLPIIEQIKRYGFQL